jgi:hypothetical protein
LNTSAARAKFVRQLYNLHKMLEREKETKDTEAKIQELLSKISNDKGRFKPFYTKDTRASKRKRTESDVNDQDAGGGAGGVGATDYAELGAHGYEVEPEEVVDESGNVIMEPFFKVCLCRSLSTYAPH